MKVLVVKARSSGLNNFGSERDWRFCRNGYKQEAKGKLRTDVKTQRILRNVARSADVLQLQSAGVRAMAPVLDEGEGESLQ